MNVLIVDLKKRIRETIELFSINSSIINKGLKDAADYRIDKAKKKAYRRLADVGECYQK